MNRNMIIIPSAKKKDKIEDGHWFIRRCRENPAHTDRVLIFGDKRNAAAIKKVDLNCFRCAKKNDKKNEQDRPSFAMRNV